MLNHTSMKRISKELESDFNDIQYSLTLYHPNKRYIELKCPLLNNILELHITPQYPFKPPRVLVNNINYIDRHKHMYTNSKGLFKKLNMNNQCPCCDTVLCDWSPGNRLYQVVEEYITKENQYIKVKTYISFLILNKQLPFDNLLFDKIFTYL